MSQWILIFQPQKHVLLEINLEKKKIFDVILFQRDFFIYI